MEGITKQEKTKYERMWELDSYRERSPGERFFLRAFADMGPVSGRDSLCDWGIGTGRAAMMFKQRGIHVEGLDIAANANKEFDGVVWVGTMWNPPLPVDKKFTFGYCTDVLEHIPPQLVMGALKGIRRHTIQECWFSIANFHDHEGDKIGEVLHLSVRPAEWWATAFSKIFPKFYFFKEPKHYIVRAFCKNHHDPRLK